MHYTIDIARSIDDISALRPAWEKWQYHPNADIDFYLTILGSRPEIIRPHVMTLYDGSLPKAIMVGRLEKSALDIKIGYKSLYRTAVTQLNIVYGGLLGDFSDRGVVETFISELINILKNREADVVLLSNVDSSSGFYDVALTYPSFFYRDHAPLRNLHWKMSLPKSVDDIYAKMSSKHRYWLRRMQRQLEKKHSDVRIESFCSGDDIRSLCNDVEEIASKTYQRSIGAGFTNTAENINRLELSARRGWLRMYLFYVNNRPAAFWIGTVYNNECHLNFTGYVPEYKQYEIGTILFLRMLEDLCRQEVQSIDFGFGNAFYKERFGTEYFEEASLYLFSTRFEIWAINIMRTLAIAFSSVVKNLLGDKFCGRVKTFWRRKLLK